MTAIASVLLQNKRGTLSLGEGEIGLACRHQLKDQIAFMQRVLDGLDDSKALLLVNFVFRLHLSRVGELLLELLHLGLIPGP